MGLGSIVKSAAGGVMGASFGLVKGLIPGGPTGPDFMKQAEAAAQEEFDNFKKTVAVGAPYVGLAASVVENRLLPNLARNGPVAQAHKKVANREFADIAAGRQIDTRVAAGGAGRISSRLDTADVARTTKRRLDAAKLGLGGADLSSGFSLGAARLAGAPRQSQLAAQQSEAALSGLGSVTYGLNRFANDLTAYNQDQRFQASLSNVFAGTGHSNTGAEGFVGPESEDTFTR